MKFKVLLIFLYLALLIFTNRHNSLYAQLSNSNTQYFHTQYFINPAYSGTINTMSMSLAARKQWFGVDKAPVNYSFSVHSPLNNTMMSLGAGASMESFGITKIYNANLTYAYLLKLSQLTFINVGMNFNYAGMDISYNEINVLHNNDPYFTLGKESANNIYSGVGVYLYSSSYFLGVSALNLIGLKKYDEHSSLNQFLNRRYINVVGGYLLGLGADFTVKPSFWYRQIAEEQADVNVGLQVLYKNMLWLGANYNNKGIMSGIVNAKVKDALSIAYTYDVAGGSKVYNKSNHEITITFQLSSLVEPNPDREFGERKTKQLIKSLRNF